MHREWDCRMHLLRKYSKTGHTGCPDLDCKIENADEDRWKDRYILIRIRFVFLWKHELRTVNLLFQRSDLRQTFGFLTDTYHRRRQNIPNHLRTHNRSRAIQYRRPVHKFRYHWHRDQSLHENGKMYRLHNNEVPKKNRRQILRQSEVWRCICSDRFRLAECMLRNPRRKMCNLLLWRHYKRLPKLLSIW